MAVVFTSIALLAWIWVGYPMAVAALAAFAIPRRRAATGWVGDLPTVSVVIATRDDASAVQRRVDDVLASEYPAALLDVVVSLDANVAAAAEAFTPRADQRVRLTRAQVGGKATAVNAGVGAATGELLVLTDTAQRFAPDAIRRLVDASADSRCGAVSGRLVIDGGDSRRSLSELYWSFERWLRSTEARLHSAVGVTGAIYAIRRDLFIAFPAGLILDDLFVPMQLLLRGFRIGYCDAAVAWEPRRFEIRNEWRRKVRTLTGVIQLCVLLPDVLKPWRNPIWIQFVFHKLLRFVSPLLLTVAALAGAAVAWDVLRQPNAQRVPLTIALGLAFVAFAFIRPLRLAATEFVVLNAAIVQATTNGIRGRWDVW